MKHLLTSATRVVLLLIILTLCYLSVRQLPVPAEFKDIALMIMSFYFGGKTSQAVDNSVAQRG